MCITVWILGDQLLVEHPALAAAAAASGEVRVLLVESASRMARLPYHRKKLVLLLAAMRHYAEALRARGYTVDYVQAPTMLAGLRQHVAAFQPDRIITMPAAEYAGRRFQQERMAAALGVAVTVLPNTQFLIGRDDLFPRHAPAVGSVARGERRTGWRCMELRRGEPQAAAQRRAGSAAGAALCARRYHPGSDGRGRGAAGAGRRGGRLRPGCHP